MSRELDMAPPTAQQQRHRVAVHEAGHAVVHVMTGGAVRVAEVHRSWWSGEVTGGRVRTQDIDGVEEDPDQLAVVALAGLHAEARWWQELFGLAPADAVATARSGLRGGGGHDDLSVARRFLRQRGSTLSLAGAERRAAAAVQEHWSRILRVGDALDRRGRLTGDVVRRLADAPRPTVPRRGRGGGGGR